MAWPLLMSMSSAVNVKTRGANMFSVNRICVAGALVSAAAAVLMASGCNAAGASALRRAAEVRVATTLEAGSPQLIVSGPARLLHVNVHGHKAVTIYSVKRDASGAVNCAAAVRSDLQALRQSASTELNRRVGEDEAVCLAHDAGDAGRTDVSWHARRGAQAPAEVLQAAND
jgi:hypothetical protein